MVTADQLDREFVERLRSGLVIVCRLRGAHYETIILLSGTSSVNGSEPVVLASLPPLSMGEVMEMVPQVGVHDFALMDHLPLAEEFQERRTLESNGFLVICALL